MANVFSTQPGRRTSLLNGAFCILVISTLLASCAKEAETLAPQPASGIKGDKEFKKCDIVKIVTIAPPAQIITFSFEYNSKGDPVKITPTHFGTGYPIRLIRYDNKGRITDYIGTDPWLSGFESWGRFVYDNKNRIIRDTAYIWGLYGDEPHGYRQDLTNINTYEYDSKDRMIKVTHNYPYARGGPYVFTESFVYDNAGNLVKPGAVYDDKMNIHRTHSFWMFLERDYSVNNSWAGILAYNKYGLPTAVSTAGFTAFAHIAPFISTIEYDCKGNDQN